VIGFAMQKAMWLQQQYTGFVARGDEVFTGLRGEDEPGLATFDEDLPADEAPAAATGFRESAFDRAEVPDEEELLSGLAEDDVALPDAAAAETADAEVRAEFSDNRAEEALDEIALDSLVDDETAGLPPEPSPAEVVAAVEEITAQVESADVLAGAPDEPAATEDATAVENALLEADAAQTTGEPGAAGSGVSDEVDVLTPDGQVETVEATVTDEGVAAPETAAEAVDEGGTPVAAATGIRTDVDEDAGPPADEGTAGAAAAGTAPIEGYDAWSIAQLRGRLRGYQAVTVTDLIAYEEATRAREPYLRMLRNRLQKLDEQAVEASPLAPRGA
jgi:hypothetical protein